MLAGLIRDDERKVASGIPGLSDIPVIGRLFAYNRHETQETDIILTLTPHIVRVLDLTEADVRRLQGRPRHRRVGRHRRAGAGAEPPPRAARPPCVQPRRAGAPGARRCCGRCRRCQPRRRP